MALKIWEKDIKTDILKDKVIAIIGYGNQGRSQALNLRDGGFSVIVGNSQDSYRETALADGQKVLPIDEAARQADILLVLLPDELQAQIITEHILGNLKDGATLCFGHGYNVHFKTFEIPEKADIIMVAPRMIGGPVRDWYQRGIGFCSYVAVAQDYTGKADEIMLAVAKGIGGASPAIKTTFEEETVMDLFGEQVGGGGALLGVLYQFEVMTEAGYDPEIAQLECYGSGELVEVAKSTYERGLIGQLYGHSHTSQYGQMRRCNEFMDEAIKEQYRKILSDIRDGTFAKQWAAEQASGYKVMEGMRAKFNQHPIITAEKSNQDVKKQLDRGKSED